MADQAKDYIKELIGVTKKGVGGKTDFISSTIVMSVAGVHADGEYIGTTTTPQYFASVVTKGQGTGVIKTVIISDKSTTTAVAMELWLFSKTFTAPTDNAAWAITDADSLNCIGVIPISDSKWYASGNNKIYSDDTMSLVIKPNATDLYYALVTRGTTPNWTSGDITISLGVLQD